MKNKKKIIFFIVLFLIVIVAVVCIFTIYNKKETIDKANFQKEYEEMKENSTMYQEEVSLEELKEEYKYSGENDIYQIETEKDGRKVINVKPSINYKVAFCGMIQKSKPNFEELDTVFEQNTIQECGIWINTDNQKQVLEFLNNTKYLNSNYKINEKGYLEIEQINNPTDKDKKIKEFINGDKQYLFSISSLYYMVDPVTGEIVDNPYNELDEYQTYEYIKDNNRMIMFITENKENKLSNDEIFESVIDLLSLAN